MLLALLLVLNAAPMKVAMPGLNAVKLEPAEVLLFSEVLASRLEERGVSVVSARDISTLLGFERQRHLLGCADSVEGSCLAELSGALGVSLMLVGDLARIDGEAVVTLKVISTTAAKTVARFEGRGGDMLELLRRAGDQLADRLVGPLPPPTFSKKWGAVPAIVAIASLSVGVWAELQSDSQLLVVRTATSISDARLASSNGKRFELLGHALLGVGAAAAVTAIVLLVMGDAPVHPVATWSPTAGPSFGLVGVWP